MSGMSHMTFLDRWIWGGLPAFVLAFGRICGPEWNVRAYLPWEAMPLTV